MSYRIFLAKRGIAEAKAGESGPHRILIDEQIKMVACGAGASYALTKKGDAIYAWGQGERGQLGVESKDTLDCPFKFHLPFDPSKGCSNALLPIKKIYAEGDQAYVLDAVNDLYGWGSNWTDSDGFHLGCGSKEDMIFQPTKILSQVKSFATSPYLAAAIKEDNSIWMWRKHAYRPKEDVYQLPQDYTSRLCLKDKENSMIIPCENGIVILSTTCGSSGLGSQDVLRSSVNCLYFYAGIVFEKFDAHSYEALLDWLIHKKPDNLTLEVMSEEQTELGAEHEPLIDNMVGKKCPLCMERARDMAFLCGHRACGVCANQLTRCHVCRQDITQKIKLYS